MLEDAQIIKLIQSGNLECVDILIDRYKNSLYKFCYHLTNSQYDADDLFQETWVKVMKNIERYNINQSFQTWLFSITSNTYKDSYRKTKRWLKKIKVYFSNDTKDIEMNNAQGVDSLPDEQLVVEEEKGKLLETVNHLDDTYRLPIILFYFKEMNYEQIAQVLDIPIGTVKSRLNTAKKKLKKDMEVDENG